MSVAPMKALLEAGVHFGHRTRRWNPKMKPFIFTERNGIHIIDLQQTITRLNQAYELVKDNVASGGIILFVGTKRQAQEAVAQEAQRCGMPYVENRWLGGTLTNWRTIRQRIDYLLEAEKKQARGEFERLIKKEALLRTREIERLNQRLGGLKDMRRLPNYLFVVDVRRDDLAVKEANVLGIPVIAMVDTNCDPDPIDYAIPCNDDAIRAIRLILSTMANAVLDGQAIYSSLQAEEEEVELEGEELPDERYLGPSTLAKIQAAVEAEAEAGEEAFAVEEPELEEPEAEVEAIVEAEELAAVISEAEVVAAEEPEVEADEPEAEPQVEEPEVEVEEPVAEEVGDEQVEAAGEVEGEEEAEPAEAEKD
ncbi:MAG: 30S ribosomal protein S2 [Anaerolineae bacterium]|nr:30S ribosomal protein S2 [Anaerolineae bacterium]